MTRVSSSEFKSKMGRYMRAVRAGEVVVITDRDRPVARVAPFTPADAGGRPPLARPRDAEAPPLGEIEVAGVSFRGTDTTALLREERDRR